MLYRIPTHQLQKKTKAYRICTLVFMVPRGERRDVAEVHPGWMEKGDVLDWIELLW